MRPCLKIESKSKAMGGSLVGISAQALDAEGKEGGMEGEGREEGRKRERDLIFLDRLQTIYVFQ